MVSRSRSMSFSMLLLCGSVMILGPMGCASAKPRENWWQFWRPKRVATTDMFHPDKMILPPPPGVLANSSGNPEHFRIGSGANGELLPPVPESNEALSTFSALQALDEPIRGPADIGSVSDLQTVFFAFDSFDLDQIARGALDNNAQWIVSHPEARIQIEGHCDDRGTVEYNYQLGQKRAQMVRSYLMQRGIQGNILMPVSYGEERPIAPGVDEAAKSRNRRAQFMVYSGGGFAGG